MPPDALDTLAESLAGTFPGCEDAPLALALLRELATGEPVVASTLSERAEAVLARWPNVNYDDAGRAIAFSGLSLTPTTHRFTVGGRQLHTWCAWDTLFLPAMLGQPADVQSTCPVTGSDVRLTVDPDGVRRHDPEPLWVSFPPAATTSTADITGTFCCHVHFLANAHGGRAVAQPAPRRHRPQPRQRLRTRPQGHPLLCGLRARAATHTIPSSARLTVDSSRFTSGTTVWLRAPLASAWPPTPARLGVDALRGRIAADRSANAAALAARADFSAPAPRPQHAA